MSERIARMPPEEDDDRYGYDEWDDLDDDDREQQRLEHLLAECGWFDEEEPWCQMAGAEFCDFECPLRHSRRRAMVAWRTRQRRRHGRGVGPDPRRPGFAPPGLVRWANRRRKARRKEGDAR